MPTRGDDPLLEEAYASIQAAGLAAEVWDASWHLYGLSDEYMVMIAAGGPVPEPGLGLHIAEPAMASLRESWPAGPTTESMEAYFERWLGSMLAEAEGGTEAFRAAATPAVQGLIDGAEVPERAPALMAGKTEIRLGRTTIWNDAVLAVLRGPDGSFAGAVTIVKPAIGAAALAMLALGDERLFERMLNLIQPRQLPGAILFGDLEGSTPLSRRLPSAAYFALVRRLSFAADQVVVDAGGIVGKHVGDGVTAFFLTSDLGSDSAAACAAIASARAIQAATPRIAERSGLSAEDVSMRFGLHWGASLYVGRLLTSGRLEVTALGDEVNEGARIESAAGGGLRLASKALIERLDPDDAAALGLDTSRLAYTPIADLPGAGEKAIRDAGSIAVSPV